MKKMGRHFEREIIKIEDAFKDLCNIAQRNFNDTINALETMDINYLNKHPALDYEIDDKEILIEEECLKTLALYQPVASDLRSIIAILKINGEIERIGDLTSGIAERAKSLHKLNMKAAEFLIPDIYKIVGKMLNDSLDAFIKHDTQKATKVCMLDDKVDKLHSQMYAVLKEHFIKNPEKYDGYVSYISISRFLERIADHTTNIAEDLLYMMEGEIFRHRKIQLRKNMPVFDEGGISKRGISKK